MSDGWKYARWRGFYSLIKITQHAHIRVTSSLQPLLSDVVFAAVSHKSPLFFTRCPVCLLVPRSQATGKGQKASERFCFPPSILRIAALCRVGAHIVVGTYDRAREPAAPAQAACVLVRKATFVV